MRRYRGHPKCRIVVILGFQNGRHLFHNSVLRHIRWCHLNRTATFNKIIIFQEIQSTLTYLIPIQENINNTVFTCKCICDTESLQLANATGRIV
jgi:hypothetical protein